jgi:hypothetical protein
MLEPIPGAPPGVIAVRAVGTVSAVDYDNVIKPAIESVLAEHGKIRFVYELGPEFTGYAPGAAWEDLKLGTGYLSKWERCAIATDHTALADVIRAFGVLMPGEVKVFPAADVDKAIAWAAG